MVDSVSLATVITLLTSNASSWLPYIRDAFLNQGADIVVGKTLQSGRRRLHLDEKEQLKHLKRVLRNAAEQSISKFSTQGDRDQLRDILATLSEQGPHFDALREEIMRLLTLSDSPNFSTLSELYNHSLRFRMLSKATPPQNVDILPYLSVFFEMLKEELYNDTLFHDQFSDVMKSRLMLDIKRSCAEVIEVLRVIGGTLIDSYTTEQFEQDLYAYSTYVESTLRRLKLVGVVPKDRGSEDVDPELELIFVPLQIALPDSEKSEKKKPKSILVWLEDSPHLVLLGGPGSGKSTAIRFLAWSHAMINLPTSSYSLSNNQLLSNKPLPLRIEIRRLVEDRRQYPTYDFLDYATNILLGRAGIHINRLMFEELLERRLMLCLFDGLDEVATLDDRQRLITEIEEFARCYPGNRIVVTSRPVGYELARFSKQSFSHAQVKEFDDRQIRMFLARWYAHVLKLDPIPPDDQQELETLYKTLKENPRLHILASNPLLLTVITALHRYERLPDRRILVYDRCAELLLDTWAKLKGTNARWKDMRMGKEDQRACVAHLGFVLHKRSQENNANKENTKDLSNDVTSRFLVKQIEAYVNNQGLISEVAEQRAEAERFLELMQIEAGLIVERGKDENGDDLYGFVHRTFQEYFAAVDVNERYLEDENPIIISQFLTTHLHDPHWHEVILLLLGKLRRKPVTAQLRLILEGRSRLSHYTEILEQDLFFVCICLIEEMPVDNELAEFVISRLVSLIKNSLFPSQIAKAFQLLTSLTHTRQYAKLGLKELRELVTQGVIADVSLKIDAIRLLYEGQAHNSPERQLALQELLALLERTDLTLEQRVKMTQTLFEASSYDSHEQQKALQELLEMLERTDLAVELRIETAQILYRTSRSNSDEKRQSTQELVAILQRTDLIIEQRVKVAEALYRSSPYVSLEQSQVLEEFTKMLERNDLTIEERVKVAEALYRSSPYDSMEEKQSVQELIMLLERNDLTVKQRVEVAKALNQSSFYDLLEERQVVYEFAKVLERNDLTLEQRVKVAEVLYRSSSSGSPEEQHAIQELTKMLGRTDLIVEERIKVAGALYRSSSYDLPEEQQVVQELTKNLERTDLTLEQRIQVVQELSSYSQSGSQEERQAIQVLSGMLQRMDLTVEQRIRAAQALYQSSFSNSQERQLAVQELIGMLQRVDLATNQLVEVVQMLYQRSYGLQQRWMVQKLKNILQDTGLLIEHRTKLAHALYKGIPLESLRRWIIQWLVDKMNDVALTIEQHIGVARVIHLSSTADSAQEQQLRQELGVMLQRTDLTVEQRVKVAQTLYLCSPDDSPERRQVTLMFFDSLQQIDPTIEQQVIVAQSLYLCSKYKSEERQQAMQIFVGLLNKQGLFVDQRFQIACFPLTVEEANYADRLWSIREILALADKEIARIHIKKSWVFVDEEVPISDLSSIVELIKEEILSTEIRDAIYVSLESMIPKFGNEDVKS